MSKRKYFQPQWSVKDTKRYLEKEANPKYQFVIRMSSKQPERLIFSRCHDGEIKHYLIGCNEKGNLI